MKRLVPQNDLIAPIKVWDGPQQIACGNSPWESVTHIILFHQVSQLQKGKDPEMTVQGNSNFVGDTRFEDKSSLKGKEMKQI